jgi:hypothetical protein
VTKAFEAVFRLNTDGNRPIPDPGRSDILLTSHNFDMCSFGPFFWTEAPAAELDDLEIEIG